MSSPATHSATGPSAAGAGGWIWGWLLAAALPVFFLCLGANTIWEANEAFYVETPARMVATGDYVTPYFNGLPRLNKPVLSYWIVAGLYHLFGVSVTVERVGIALGAMGIIACAFLIGRALRSTSTGLLAALIVAVAPRVVMWSRRIAIDVYITFFMSLALACFVCAERQPAHRRRWLTAMYVAMGLGVLTKGPIAVFFPVVTCALWFAVERRWRDWSALMLLPGALVVVAIVVPWYASLYQAHGWEPITQFFVGENLERFAAPDYPDHRAVWFYLPVLLTDLFPWAPLVVLSLFAGWRARQARESAEHASVRRLLWIWIVTIVGVFSFSQSKQDLYIFPVIAAVAALVADTFLGAVAGFRQTAVARVLLVVALCSMATAGAGYWLFGSGYYELAGITAASSVLFAGAAAAAVFAWRRRLVAAAVALTAAFIAFDYTFVVRMLPSVERLKPTAAIAETIRAHADSRGNVGYYRVSLPSLSYYTGRTIEQIDTPEQAYSFYYHDQGGWAVMSEEGYAELRREIGGRVRGGQLCVIARHPLFQASLEDFVSRRPPPDVLLVSNKGCG